VRSWDATPGTGKFLNRTSARARGQGQGQGQGQGRGQRQRQRQRQGRTRGRRRIAEIRASERAARRQEPVRSASPCCEQRRLEFGRGRRQRSRQPPRAPAHGAGIGRRDARRPARRGRLGRPRRRRGRRDRHEARPRGRHDVAAAAPAEVTSVQLGQRREPMRPRGRHSARPGIPRALLVRPSRPGPRAGVTVRRAPGRAGAPRGAPGAPAPPGPGGGGGGAGAWGGGGGRTPSGRWSAQRGGRTASTSPARPSRRPRPRAKDRDGDGDQC